MRLLALMIVLPLVACGGPTDDDVVVFAASSLTDAFDDIADAYASSTGESVVISAAGSSDLAAQIDEGAPADVFASADVATMDRIDGADGAARIFATNRAEIVVEPGNPHGIATLGDLADPELLVVVCAEQVPCGAYTTEVLDRAGIDLTPVSFESNVRAVLTKVELGEADAGVVYATDIAAAAERVDGVAIADEFNVDAEYPIVALGESGEAFVDFIVGDEAQAILREHGFGAP
ncbi:MAG: molybdate ABC transporter substrate-binding protein [Ilumatobacter fluminis]|uniref:molybdate ABC transporter substrate-binding protein n=1 Tax=Ilumatobacter fluminis TaxID=467091 RepID=UPI0032EDB510